VARSEAMFIIPSFGAGNRASFNGAGGWKRKCAGDYLLPLKRSLFIRAFNRLTQSFAASSAVLTQKPEMSEPPLYS